MSLVGFSLNEPVELAFFPESEQRQRVALYIGSLAVYLTEDELRKLADRFTGYVAHLDREVSNAYQTD